MGLGPITSAQAAAMTEPTCVILVQISFLVGVGTWGVEIGDLGDDRARVQS
jgi:hypothetical protein